MPVDKSSSGSDDQRSSRDRDYSDGESDSQSNYKKNSRKNSKRKSMGKKNKGTKNDRKKYSNIEESYYNSKFISILMNRFGY